jgi:hypothetical protein
VKELLIVYSKEKNMESTKNQLKLIKEITKILEDHQILYWLVGGWAVDFLAGKITRLHHDIDLTIWTKDVTQVENVMKRQGYKARNVNHPNESLGYIKDNIEITFFLIETDGTKVINPGRFSDWPWPKDSFIENHYKILNGVG